MTIRNDSFQTHLSGVEVSFQTLTGKIYNKECHTEIEEIVYKTLQTAASKKPLVTMASGDILPRVNRIRDLTNKRLLLAFTYDLALHNNQIQKANLIFAKLKKMEENLTPLQRDLKFNLTLEQSSTSESITLSDIFKSVVLWGLAIGTVAAIGMTLGKAISTLAYPPITRFNRITGSNPIIDSNSIIGSNHLATRTVDLSTSVLRAVELHSPGNVVITSSEPKQYLEMTADDNLLNYLKPHVNDQSLILSIQNGIAISTSKPISYHLHIPHTALNKLVVSGSGSMQVDRLETEKLKCKITGQARITINNGHVTEQTVTISGQGTYSAPDFQAKHSIIDISGQGNARVHTKQSLDVDISGMGECIYSGAPQQIQKSVSGMGRILSVN